MKKLVTMLFLTVLIFSCKFVAPKDKKKDELKKTDNVDTIFAINTTKSVKGEINDYIELNGDIKTKVEVDVYPDVMGKLVKIYVNIGDYVTKGAVIAEVDPSKPGMNYELSPVKSTISGTVTAIPLQIGATVSQQSSIIRVGDLKDVQIISYVSEKYISKMKLGLNVIVQIEAYPDVQFYGQLGEISPVVDPQTRMMEIKTNLLKNDSRIKPGMFSKIKIITEKKTNIVKIPAECLIKRYGENFVFVVKEDSFVEKRKVTPGIQIDNKIEIVNGLLPDEDIVIRGQTLLEDKTKIKVIDRVAPLSSKDIIE